MLKGLISRVVGGSNEREIEKLQPFVDAINGLEPRMEQRTGAELRALTDRFRDRLAAGETLDDLMVEAFAAVRETAKRTVDMRPFDVQLIGGVVLHQGKVAEMRTGEGKTLVATMPIYLNALSGRGVHLVTVNDYLARRDTLWMAPIYHLLGLSVGLLQSGAEQPAYIYDPDYEREPYPGLRLVPRREAYGADITYGTNNEFGFDYLRDNLALTLEGRVQRPLYYAIVDEVDNIFIDEARTPLIISGPSDEPVEEYGRFAAIARKLEPEIHYELGEKERSVVLTDAGLAVVEQETGIENIYDEANYRFVHYMQQALKAQVLFLEGRDYIRQRMNIILIDQHTGRLMPSRRLSEGLHQAIEAKEGVPVRPRDVTSATITIQNYFRMYDKLAGMSGTAVTEAEEFFKIYNLDVLSIPTNMPVIREDHADVVYRSEEAKLRAVARAIVTSHSQGQPVLVGTTSVEKSEQLSRRLTAERLQMAVLVPRLAYALQDADVVRDERDTLRETLNTSLETLNIAAWRKLARALDLSPNALDTENLQWASDYLGFGDEPASQRRFEKALRDGIPHEILNAKEHTREAIIIARAGEPGSVTIATNMAGRGVDIKLGGELSDEVNHRAVQVISGRGLDPFSATPAQMDSAIAEVVPQYAQHREQALAAGGLHILGTERHEARRIDNQLRGRSGRQGEPGSSRFYLSLEDDLMRRFGRKEMLSKLMEQIGDDFPIEHNLVSRTIERAQTSVEGYNFDIRKHLLEYDDVLSRQRETIYDERLRILKSDDLRPEVWRMLERQVDEYLDKYGEEPDQRRFVFSGLDDVAPLLLSAPNGPFQGPLVFSGHLTAFPSFTVSFLAEQLADGSPEATRQRLWDLAQRAAASYGEQTRGMIEEMAQDVLDKQDEQLEYYQALLNEKIEDYAQVAEERGEMPDLRRLAQHLERTYPFRLTIPRGLQQTGLDNDSSELRAHWLAEIEIEFHRQICAGFIDRVQIRLPADVRLDRLRPARIPAGKLDSELQRVRQLAAKQPRGETGRERLESFALPTNPDATQVSDFVTIVKEASKLDYGRLDRLVGHVLGAYLDDLIGLYLGAIGEGDGRLRRDLEGLQASVIEGKKGRRAADLTGVLRQMNDLVHLEISDLEQVLEQAVAHEFDKWAQRQLTEIEADAVRVSLTETDWTSIAEHILATHYAERQVYDRGHRRQIAWLPRLPLGYMAQSQVEDMDVAALREAVLASVQWVLDQREQVWGLKEFQRWEQLSAGDLDAGSMEGLTRFFGEQQLGDQRDLPVEDLPPDLYDRLHLGLALRQWEERDLRLGDLPQADVLLDHLGKALEEDLLATPIGELDASVQDLVGTYLREGGYLDDQSLRSRLVERPIENWDQATTNEVAGLLGQEFIAEHAGQSFVELDPQAREAGIAYLQRQHRFVDEDRVQRFLVYEGLGDLPPEIQAEALSHLARSRLDRLSRRKIANLDVKIRQEVVASLQRRGLFTDQHRRDELLSAARSLDDLEPEVRSGFGAFLARQELGDGSLNLLEPEVNEYVLAQVKLSGVLNDPALEKGLEELRLDELEAGPDGDTGYSGTVRISEDLVAEVIADLGAKTMEDLPAETRQLVHDALDEQNYFVDQERVGWYERRTLAQLPSESLHGLEQCLGQIRLAETAETPFRDLPSGVRQSLLSHFDSTGLLKERAARLRLTQAGTLAELSESDRVEVARHLGRQWLTQIRDKRPPALPDSDREVVWACLRAQGQFSDEFKEELFVYQRLGEFDQATRETVERAVADKFASVLRSTPIGELPPDLQDSVRTRLNASDYFMDEARLRQLEEVSLQSLPPDQQDALERALGGYILSDLVTTPVDQLPADVQSAFWRYLDEVGYLVDDELRSKYLDHPLTDLESHVYDALVSDLAANFEQEIGHRPVAELEDGLRQALREALESMGFFESEEVRQRVLAQRLGTLRREDLEALSTEFGQMLLNAWAGQSLSDLPAEEREVVLKHLHARDWFLDQDRLQRLQTLCLGDLEGKSGVFPDGLDTMGLQQDLVGTLRRQQLDQLRRQRLLNLDADERRTVLQVLRELEVALPEDLMRPLRRQRVIDLDQDTYHDLLQSLGEDIVAQWGPAEFQELEDDQRSLVSAYLGRAIIGRIERRVLLHTISRLWIGYLTDIEDLRRGIGLEAYGQRDPLVEYKRRAFELFEELGDNIRRTAVRSLFQQLPQPLRSP